MIETLCFLNTVFFQLDFQDSRCDSWDLNFEYFYIIIISRPQSTTKHTGTQQSTRQSNISPHLCSLKHGVPHFICPTSRTGIWWVHIDTANTCHTHLLQLPESHLQIVASNLHLTILYTQWSTNQDTMPSLPFLADKLQLRWPYAPCWSVVSSEVGLGSDVRFFAGAAVHDHHNIGNITHS